MLAAVPARSMTPANNILSDGSPSLAPSVPHEDAPRYRKAQGVYDASAARSAYPSQISGCPGRIDVELQPSHKPHKSHEMQPDAVLP